MEARGTLLVTNQRYRCAARVHLAAIPGGPSWSPQDPALAPQLVRTKDEEMLKSIRFAAVGGFIALSMAGPALAQNENAKWFVVRNDSTGDCWSAMLIQINGEYAHGFAQLAGGPYDTKEDALAREKQLEQNGTCRTAS